MENNRELYLSFGWVLFIFIYYFSVFLIGAIASLVALVPELYFTNPKQPFVLAILGAIGMSSMGSAIFYLRKLYKTCFLVQSVESNNPGNKLKKTGTIIYFIGRPLFSIGFSLMVIVSLRAGFILTSKQPIQLDEGFIYLSMLLSFYVGFLSGRFIKNLEKSGEKMLVKIAGNEK